MNQSLLDSKVVVRLSSEVRRQLEERARQAERTVAAETRLAIKNWLKEVERCPHTLMTLSSCD